MTFINDFLQFFRKTNYNFVYNFGQFWAILEKFYNFDFLTLFTIFYHLVIFYHFDNYKDKTFDIWDTDYNSDSWETEFMTIFVTYN